MTWRMVKETAGAESFQMKLSRERGVPVLLAAKVWCPRIWWFLIWMPPSSSPRVGLRILRVCHVVGTRCALASLCQKNSHEWGVKKDQMMSFEVLTFWLLNCQGLTGLNCEIKFQSGIEIEVCIALAVWDVAMCVPTSVFLMNWVSLVVLKSKTGLGD